MLRAMDARLLHRGTRSIQREYFDGQVRVGFRRLPIQGLSEDLDPPASTNRWDAYLVGEVLNFRKLRPLAETDLLVVLEEWDQKPGPRHFQRYDGFWAMVFIDKFNMTVQIVTDPLAKKPLYMRRTPFVAISSEIDPLLELGPFQSTFDAAYLGGVMKWGYCHDGSTPYREIRAIPPGTIMMLDSSDGEIIRQTFYGGYIDRPPSGRSLAMLMHAAVQNRLVSDVPVSLLLSGGLDSTIVFELTKCYTTDFTVFHVDNDEEEYLNYLKFPSGVKLVRVKLEEVDLSSAVNANQTPVDLGSVVPQYAIGKMVRRAGFDVAISGDGADELFGGYRRAAEFDSQRSDVYHELVHYHLPRLDRLMMASTVELRCPFLSWDVIRFAWTIPWVQRRSKEYLKEQFAGIVPAKILNRAKVPLKVPGIRGDKKIEWRRKMLDEFLKLRTKEAWR